MVRGGKARQLVPAQGHHKGDAGDVVDLVEDLEQLTSPITDEGEEDANRGLGWRNHRSGVMAWGRGGHPRHRRWSSPQLTLPGSARGSAGARPSFAAAAVRTTVPAVSPRCTSQTGRGRRTATPAVTAARPGREPGSGGR